jgi:hypothetical protein
MSSNSEEEDDEEYFNRDQDDFNDVNQSLMFSELSEKYPTQKIKKDQKKASLPTYELDPILNKFTQCSTIFGNISEQLKIKRTDIY